MVINKSSVIAVNGTIYSKTSATRFKVVQFLQLVVFVIWIILFNIFWLHDSSNLLFNQGSFGNESLWKNTL